MSNGENPLTLTVDEYQNQLTGYLNSLNLPSEHVLVDVSERKIVIGNTPAIISRIDEQKKMASFYISKFVAACGAGLFDAALNYLWDETIVCLRKKIVEFDLDYFKSTIQEDKIAKKIESEDDLRNIDDNDIIQGCFKIGLISEVGYRYLDHIRWMRNWVSAAHPNQEELDGLKLCDWLNTCIKEVIGKEPVEPAIAIKKLIINIKKNVFTEKDAEPIRLALDTTPVEYVCSLAEALFGMFCEPDGRVETRDNIRLIAFDMWNLLPESTRKKFGIKHAKWSVNGDLQRKEFAHEFLEKVGGLSYLSENEMIVEFSNALTHLYRVHFGFNNFYNEPSFASLIMKYVPENGKIPESVREQYVKVIVMCYIGNGYGVSDGAYSYYEQMVDKFTDFEITCFLKLFSDEEFASQLQCSDCQRRCVSLIEKFKAKTVKTSCHRVFDFLTRTSPNALTYVRGKEEYKKLIKDIA